MCNAHIVQTNNLSLSIPEISVRRYNLGNTRISDVTLQPVTPNRRSLLNYVCDLRLASRCTSPMCVGQKAPLLAGREIPSTLGGRHGDGNWKLSRSRARSSPSLFVLHTTDTHACAISPHLTDQHRLKLISAFSRTHLHTDRLSRKVLTRLFFLHFSRFLSPRL